MSDLISILKAIGAIAIIIGMLGAAGPALGTAWVLFKRRHEDRLVGAFALTYFTLGLHILGFIPMTAPLPRPLPGIFGVMLAGDLILLGIGVTPAALMLLFPKPRPGKAAHAPSAPSRRSQVAVFLVGLVTLVISAASLLGHIVQLLWLHTWIAGAPGMAPNTALAFIVVGIGFIVLSRQR